MRWKTAVIMCFLLAATPGLSSSEEWEEPRPNMSAYEHANENARFKRTQDLFNNKANKEIRADKLAEKEVKKASKARRKMEERDDKGEGQVKFKF